MAITALSHFEAVCLLHSLCSSDGNFFQFTSSHHSTDFSFFLYQYLIRNRMKKPLSSFLLLQSDYWLLTSPIMAFSSCLCNSQILLKIDHSRLSKKLSGNIRKDQFITFALKGTNTDLFGQHAVSMRSKLKTEWSFKGGSRTISGPNIQRFVQHRKSFGVYASWFTNPQIASSVFTLGTVAVLPFYTLMVLAPKAELTKKSIESAIPYVVLGLLYAFLLYLSWTPDTIRLMFASQYWLPELSGIAKMFSSEMTLASAWIHLLAVDLFAARQVFHDGLENNVETRHSVSLCLLFCPIGIAVHVFTKALTTRARNTKREIH